MCVNTLNYLNIGQEAFVKDISIHGSMRRRLQDIGIIKGTRIECIQKSFFGDPIAYLIRGAVIALRNEDSQNIIVDIISGDNESER